MPGDFVHVDQGVGTAGTLSVSDLNALADAEERLLRAQFHPKPAPAEMDAELLALLARATDLTGALRRWREVCTLRRGIATGAHTISPAEAREAHRQLITRVPVHVHVSTGRRVALTGRGRAAMLLITEHWQRIRLLNVEMERAARVFHAAEVDARSGHPSALRRLRVAQDANRALFREVQYHWQRLYAHALRKDPGPAPEDEPPPAWCAELTDEDDVCLILGLVEAGAGRLARAETLRPPQDDNSSMRSYFGWDSVLASIEKELAVAPATLQNADLGQTIAWVWAQPVYEPKD